MKVIVPTVFKCVIMANLVIKALHSNIVKCTYCFGKARPFTARVDCVN